MQLRLFQEVQALVQADLEALKRCSMADVVAVDVETQTRWPGQGPSIDYGLSYPADVTVIALAWEDSRGLQSTALAAPFALPIIDFLRTLFRQSTLMVAHNAVFDMRQLSKYTERQTPEHIWDTQSMARLLHPALNVSYSLLGVAAQLNIPVPERQQALKSQRGKLHLLPIETALRYAQDDAILALQIYQKQRHIPADSALIDWECRAIREYCRMTAEGVRLNQPFVEQRLRELAEQRDLLQQRLQADGLVNPGSSQARARYLYQHKAIPLPSYEPDSRFFTRAGRHRLRAQPGSMVQLTDLSTGSSVIESYMEEGSPYIDRLRDLAAFMDIDWFISTLKGLLDHAIADGRLHSLVTIATDSGRRASSYPHMQNWKMPDMAGVAIGDDGFTLVEIDYGNAENVMAALIASDSALAATCATTDFHSTTAAQYFGTDWENADPVERQYLRGLAKKITYGTAYGMGAESLAKSLGVSLTEAQRLIRAKDDAFPEVTRRRNQAKAQARLTGRLKLWTGRPVPVPSAFVAWNFLCQGGVSELLKRAIVLISEVYRAHQMRSRVVLDIHDALILEVAHSEWDLALSLAIEIMTHITPDTLNNRTNPPIRWSAMPKLEANRHKWGAQQWHPLD